jgi:uncharacterized protein (DUF433 family)
MAPTKNVIIRDPDVLGGTPVFRGTWVPFQALLDYLEGGQTLDEFLDDFPTVPREAAVQVPLIAPSRSLLATLVLLRLSTLDWQQPNGDFIEHQKVEKKLRYFALDVLAMDDSRQ